MTKKDYIAIGSVLRDERMLAQEKGYHMMVQCVDIITAQLCIVFRADNPQFKEQRFRDFVAGKCGPNGGAR